MDARGRRRASSSQSAASPVDFAPDARETPSAKNCVGWLVEPFSDTTADRLAQTHLDLERIRPARRPARRLEHEPKPARVDQGVEGKSLFTNDDRTILRANPPTVAADEGRTVVPLLVSHLLSATSVSHLFCQLCQMKTFFVGERRKIRPGYSI